MKTKLIYILSLLTVLIAFYLIKDTYALFESEKILVVHPDIAKWNIYINGNNINSEEEFVIDEFNVQSDENTLEGKLAPSLTGYFDIEIDPTNTEVSLEYEIKLSLDEIANDIEITKVEEINGQELNKIEDNTYSNILLLSDINNRVKNNIRVYLKWNNNEKKNDVDSELGGSDNNKLEIPVTINVKQYLG